MAIKVFSEDRILFEGRVKSTSANIKWVLFGSVVWTVFAQRSSKPTAFRTAKGTTRSGAIKEKNVRVVKADGKWYVVSRSPSKDAQLTSVSIRKFVDF